VNQWNRRPAPVRPSLPRKTPAGSGATRSQRIALNTFCAFARERGHPDHLASIVDGLHVPPDHVHAEGAADLE
jgi:hypothetical protein